MTSYSSKMERLRIFPFITVGAGLLGSKVSTEVDFTEFTPRNFFFSGYIEDAVYVPSFPTTFPQLAGRIGAAAAAVTSIMLTNV
jgi:hypothetical protein